MPIRKEPPFLRPLLENSQMSTELRMCRYLTLNFTQTENRHGNYGQ